MRTIAGSLVTIALVVHLVAGPAPAQTASVRSDVAAQSTDISKRIAELERVVPALLDSGQVTGLSIALIADGAIVWSRGFGMRSSGTGQPVDSNTVFEAASLSKPVLAYGVMKLVDDGKLDLDKPLADYLPYEDIAHDERYKRITARMVLSHSSGFPNWRPREGRLTIGFEPGSKFSYSGEGFVYLQKVVEQLTGQPLTEFMDETVLQPLGMTRSSYIWDERFADNVAAPHASDGSAMEKQTLGGPGNAAASLHTTAPDFARFMIAIMHGEALSKSSAQGMLTPQVEVDPGVSWGLGTGLESSERGLGFWHWGHNDGYRAYTLGYRNGGDGVVWFTNSSNGMLILRALLHATMSGQHPSLAWLDYEPYDAPARRVRFALENTIRAEGLEVGIRVYHELKSTYPPEAFGENMLNTLGYALLRSDLIDAAIGIFQLNIEQFPDAWNPYDSLGEAYMVAGQLDLAIKYYEKSLELNPDNTNGTAMLERIRAQLKEQQQKAQKRH
jgi:CubicO group peptidase (beta-lactamase class C family)